MILKGKKIVLRPTRLKDAQLFVKWSSDPEVNKFTSREKTLLKEEQKRIKDIIGNKQKVDFVIETIDGSPIGSVGLTFSKRDRFALYGIEIGDKNYWGKGYGEDATKTILSYAFDKLRLHRVELNVYAYNVRAIHLYKKLRFKVEGVRRDRCLYKGKFYDEIMMSRLNNE